MLKVDEISHRLNIPVEELLKESIVAYLEKELRLAEEDIADIRDRYDVISKEELEKKVKDGKIYSHPAWEDLITWENTESYISKIKDVMKVIG
jgi:hypothetical protein